jgi:hypothetical protein
MKDQSTTTNKKQTTIRRSIPWYSLYFRQFSEKPSSGLDNFILTVTRPTNNSPQKPFTTMADASPSGSGGGNAVCNEASGSMIPCPCHGFFGEIQFCPPAVAPNSKHPSWAEPVEKGGLFKGLMVNNSLTGTMVPFRPAHGNHVLWYTCGPTVYGKCVLCNCS